MQVFTPAIFIIAQNWKQPKCYRLLHNVIHNVVCEWISKLWYVHTIKYYSVIKKNKLSTHVTPWVNLKCILINQRSQSEKCYLLYDSIYMTFWKKQNYKDKKTDQRLPEVQGEQERVE